MPRHTMKLNQIFLFLELLASGIFGATSSRGLCGTSVDGLRGTNFIVVRPLFWECVLDSREQEREDFIHDMYLHHLPEADDRGATDFNLQVQFVGIFCKSALH